MPRRKLCVLGALVPTLLLACSPSSTDPVDGMPPPADTITAVDSPATDPQIDAASDGSADGAPPADGPDGGPTRPPPTVCNGDARLCSRRYDEVAYPTTHNAMASLERGFIIANQRRPMEQQLADGVRAMMLDTHYDNDNPRTGVPSFCHGNCSLGEITMAEGLGILRTFMEQNPDEVLSLLIENHITGEATATAFEEAGLLDLLHTHQAGSPWPTLSEMIQSGRRLVVFSETEGGTPAWYHDLYALAAETPYDFDTPEDFSCAQNRGPATGELFLVNHFLTNPTASEKLAEQVNHNPLLIERARQCEQERGQLPNFLTVDFYEIGDLFAAVRTLNGL